MALPTSRGQTRHSDGARVARVACRARADSAVVVRPAYGVAVRAAARRRRRAYNRDQRMWRPARVPRLVTLGEFDLVGFQARFAEHRRPRYSRVAAVQELLVDRFVTAAAVPRRQLRDNREAVVLLTVLPLRGLVAVEAADPSLCVAAHFVLMHD